MVEGPRRSRARRRSLEARSAGEPKGVGVRGGAPKPQLSFRINDLTTMYNVSVSNKAQNIVIQYTTIHSAWQLNLSCPQKH